MKRIVAHFVQRRRAAVGDERGQGLTEYMIMLALIAVAVILIINVLEPTIANVFSRFARQAPVAPPSLLLYTPPATSTSPPTVDPNATATDTPVGTATPTSTSTPTHTPTHTPTPTPTGTPTPPTPVSVTFASIGAEDGYVHEQANNNQGGSSSSSGAIQVGDDNHAQNRQKKGILSFDTSTLPPGATIVSAQLRIRRSGASGNPYGSLGTIVADVAPPNGFSANYALQNSDFQAAAANQIIALFTQAGSNGAWAEATFLSHGLPNINRTGRTQFRIYFTNPDNGNRLHDRIDFYGGEAAAGSRPELIITYTVP